VVVAACGSSTSIDDFEFTYPMDDELTLSHVQSKGTHNSYHVAPDPFVLADWNYTHAPLDEQLDNEGVRQIELDLNFEPVDGVFEVYHFYRSDEGTTCRRLTQCLEDVKSWSDQHPGHKPVAIMLELKDLYVADSADEFIANLEGEITSVWPEQRIITPDEVRGTSPTLRQGLIDNGWPTLGQLRGRVLFWLDESEEFHDHYTFGGTSLEGRLAFIDSELDAPYAAIMNQNNPVSGADAIAAAAAQNLLVRTRLDRIGDETIELDPTLVDAALTSGAHFLSTDVRTFSVPEGTPSRCNPVTAPSGCTAADIEDPVQLGP
jgi:hypothetical protein